MHPVLLLAPLTLLLAAAPGDASRPALPRAASLLDLGQSGVRDTNGDGLPDGVAARILLPDTPSLEDAEAATHLAGRLGFETTAATFPFVFRESEAREPRALPFPILLGRGTRALKALAAQGKVDLQGLQPGEGLVARVASPFGGPDGLVVTGGDDTGTAAAALELGARLPRLWNPTGATLGMAEAQARDWLAQRGLQGQAIALAVRVASDRRGLSRLELAVEGCDPAAARKAFEALAAAHQAGQEVRVLNFAEVAEVHVRIGQGAPVVLRRLGQNVRSLTPPLDPDTYLPEPPKDGAPAPTAPAKPHDLATALTAEGWLGDVYPDLIPDRIETLLILGDPQDGPAAAQVAARLGLESTGITLPLAKPARKVRDAAQEASPILVGRQQPLVARLERMGRVRFDDLRPGEGLLQVVPRAFGPATATVIAGLDTAGTERAATYVARRLPQLWDTARGAHGFEDLVQEGTRFFAAKSPAGQAAQALSELDEALDSLKDRDTERFEVSLFLDQAEPGLEAFLTQRLRTALPKAELKVSVKATTDPVNVLDETVDFPWEVQEARDRFQKEVLPEVKPGSRVDLDLRLSEPIEVRRALEAELRAAILKAGGQPGEVRVLNAYKQGFSWITETLLPDLKALKPAGIRLLARPQKAQAQAGQVFQPVPGRWLMELFPVDEVLTRELGLDLKAIQREVSEAGLPGTYTVEALDAAGGILGRWDFTPRSQPREYLDPFPGWATVEVTTGGLLARVDGKVVADPRIPTDMERVWDHVQGKVLPKVKAHVLKVTGGNPSPSQQPFHRDLRFEVWASEADVALGIDQERISSLEALHEDLYFVTLDFYTALGRRTSRQKLNAPGLIMPVIHPPRVGQGARLQVRYDGNAALRPRLELSWRTRTEENPGERKRDLGRIETAPPAALRAVVGADRLRLAELQVEPRDEKEALRATAALANLQALQAAGLFRKAFGFGGVEQVDLRLPFRDAWPVFHFKAQPKDSPVIARGPLPGPDPLVTWDHVIGPEESEALVRKLAAFPVVQAYQAGHTYRGRPLSALELTLPSEGERVSLNKLTALKPTLMLVGRQHANEVSSTSHILRLLELLARDPAQQARLKQVNVVAAPVWNADGAALAFELQKLTPQHILHAGRYSALGSDVSTPDQDLLPETALEARLWRDWLPDIHLNSHGYPSHEWTQPFAGYVPPGFRLYWGSRGWYAIMSGLFDPREPDQARGALSLQDAIGQAIQSEPAVRDMNLRHQDRYRRWAHAFAPHVFPLDIHRDTVFQFTDSETGQPKGSLRAPASPVNAVRRTALPSAWPQVTVPTGITEAPDETAQGPWMDLVCRAGLAYVQAHLRYLAEGRREVHRLEEATADGATLTWLRVRPVVPEEPKK